MYYYSDTLKKLSNIELQNNPRDTYDVKLSQDNITCWL